MLHVRFFESWIHCHLQVTAVMLAVYYYSTYNAQGSIPKRRLSINNF
jgi:hypothetical protein